jgi:hypothetical protein
MPQGPRPQPGEPAHAPQSPQQAAHSHHGPEAHEGPRGKPGDPQGRPVDATAPAGPAPSASPAQLKALEGQLPQLVARGVISKADAAVLQQYIRSGRVPETDAGRAALQRALDAAEQHVGSEPREGHVPGLPAASRVAPSSGARGGGNNPDSHRSIDDVILKASGRSLQTADFHFLAEAARTREGGQNLADALEWLISQPGGAQRMIDMLGQASRGENTAPMSEMLARMADASPEQTLGLLLLTTDAAGGTRELVRFFAAMGERPQSAMQFASFFERVTKSREAAGSMAELLETLTSPSPDADRSGSRVMARLLSESSSGPRGAKSLNAGFAKTVETEGGGRAFARVLYRLTTTADGSLDSGAMLRNLSNQDAGSEAVSRLMSRAAASRDGARQLVESFTRMGASEAGRGRTAEVLARIIEAPSGGRFLANLTSDAQNAKVLGQLLERLDATAHDRLARAFGKLSASPEMGILEQRAQDSPELGRILEHFLADKAGPAPERPAPMRSPVLSGPFALLAGSDEPAAARPGAMAEGPAARHPSESSLPTAHAAAVAEAGGEGATTSRGLRPEKAAGGTASFDELPSEQRPSRPLVAAPVGGAETQGGGTDRGGTGWMSSGEKEVRRSEAVHAAGESDAGQPQKAPGRFRPGDVYSQSTLLAARICGECGFRLTPSGRCLRCEEYAWREMADMQARAVRPL